MMDMDLHAKTSADMRNAAAWADDLAKSLRALNLGPVFDYERTKLVETVDSEGISMITILETAAKAMYARNAAAASGRPPWDKATEQVKAHFVELARAAFESAREPTLAMAAAGQQCEAGTYEEDIPRIFSAMITAILEEKM
jgi:hypothetical protein